jgi:hypothetical protein
MENAYHGCTNLSGDMYIYSYNVRDASNCFEGRSNSKKLDIYVPEDSNTSSSFLQTSYPLSIVGDNVDWSVDSSTNTYYNTYMIFIYIK